MIRECVPPAPDQTFPTKVITQSLTPFPHPRGHQANNLKGVFLSFSHFLRKTLAFFQRFGDFGFCREGYFFALYNNLPPQIKNCDSSSQPMILLVMTAFDVKILFSQKKLHTLQRPRMKRCLLEYMRGARCVLSHFGQVQLFATTWTIAHQAPLSMDFSGQGYWSG